MADVVWSDVLAFAPELSTVDIGAQTDILSYVNEIDLSQVTDTAQVTRMARIYLAAHFGSVQKRARQGIGGPVTSESAGALRRSYGLSAMPSGEEGLGTSMYGMSYLTILRMSLSHGPFLV